MSIRYKIASVFLMTSLIPFIAVGTLVFVDFQNSLRGSTFRNLEAVTTLQEQRVVDLLTGYSQGTAYLAQQPSVRQAVQSLLRDPKTKPQLDQILAGILAGSASNQVTPSQGIIVTDPNGKVLTSTTPYFLQRTLPLDPSLLLSDINSDGHGAYMLFGTPMVFDGKTLARFYLSADAQALVAILQNRDGLGQTGETFLVKRIDNNNGVFVTPLRFDKNAAFTRKIPLNLANRPSAQSVLMQEKTFTNGAVSYRSKPVVAVTRYIQQAGLGLVGQIDQSEVFGPINELALQAILFSALLISFAIFVGSFMSDLFTKPILSLAYTAAILRSGDFSVRAKVGTNDEIGQLGHAFNAMADGLAKQDQAKADVIALISHQLRTPATAVKGLLALVMQGENEKLTEDKKKLLHAAYTENEKLNKLITQVLEVSYADADKTAVKRVPTDLVKLAQAVVKDNQAMLELRNQTIKLTPAPEPIIVAIDPDRIRYVIDNLITNASKYSPKGSQIRLALGKDERRSWIQVADSGFGISHEDQRRLFQKFSRIHNANIDSSEGLGLGLYMTKKIVDQHQGTLTVSSSENSGSTFTIELPNT